jgi:excisionase family DNA binding protein
MGEKMMSQEEVLKFLGVERKTLYTYRKEFGMPSYKVGGKLFFRESELIEWIGKYKEKMDK